MALTPGTKLGPYEIQSPLGTGGMGEVYRATDTKLGRDIALKVLPAEMAQDPERLGRFRREAKTLAQLDHPNIVTIHSVEECGGIHFLTMQLVEGLPLDRLIPQGGLPVEQIIEIAGALGDALAAAHEKGIVHRDLKPANVMVSNEGRVKVLDFGLAKDIRVASLSDATMTSDSRTQVGLVMGTPAYMSPEQTSGRPLDHRTDIFSLGVLLHEMATGQRPFNGSSSAELVSAILRDDPPSVIAARPDLPSDLARIVRRCMEKDPRHRVQTARDVSNEFRDLARQTSRKTAPATTSATRTAAVADSGGARADEGFWVAVLPFKYSGGNADLTALAEGLTEDIVTGLSRFSYLRVIARNSTTRYAHESFDVRTSGKELGARYVMEGSLRHAGTKLRLAVQLVDATTGAHLWAETYVNTFDPEAIFELQEELVPRIVATVADTRGVLPHSMSEALRGKPPEQLTPYEALLRSFAYFQRIVPEEHALARTALERAVEQAPGNADAWAMLAILYREEYTQAYNPLPEPLERAFRAAQRAIELAPSNHYGYHALASVMFLRGDRQTFKSVAERALILNPMDSFTLAYMGIVFAYSGDWERGCALAEKARSVNPHHPGWYWFPALLNAYRKGDYRNALEMASRVNMPGFWRTEVALAAIQVALGDFDAARGAARRLLAFRPEFASVARAELEKWWEPELVEQLLGGLRQAGLEIPEAGPASSQAISATSLSTSASRVVAVADSGAARADEGFWVAVLPFKSSGGNADLAALADGLTDDIATNMSKFSYLRVVARGSTAQYAQRTVDVRTAAKELGARYVMEGSIRQAGAKVRMAVQLVDANAGSSLWAETYDRPFTPEETLDVLDDVVPRIVATVGDAQGILAHSMTEALRNRDPESLTPYEALLRSFGFHQHVSEDEHLAGITALESAVKKAPEHADCWAMLSWLYRAEYTHGYHSRPDSMDRSLTTARRAVNLAPASQLAHAALASAHFFRGELGEFRVAAERALALNRMQGYTTAFLGLHFAYSGDWERGCALAERATELNPNHPGWYWLPMVINRYRQHDGERALQHALKINMPGLWTAQVALAVVNSQLGKMDQARNALRALLAARPDFAARAREDLSIWWQPEMVEQMLGDLGKAGLTPSGAAVLPPTSSVMAPAQTASGESRADEGFWVAVLPFKYAGTSVELKALADGLSEEIVTGLSRFSYLRVIARGSTAKYSSESGDMRAIGKDLGARYVMEGSLRQAGSKLRLAVQLVDATAGTHLWAETYERVFTPESVFEVQDDLVPRLVSTVADQYGVLPRSMSDVLRNKSEDSLTPHEAVLRAFSYFTRITPEEHAAVRRILERAVRAAPDHADSWAMLSMLYRGEFAQGYNAGPNPLDRALAAAQHAVDLAPTHALGHYTLATVYFFRKEIIPFQVETERALTLNPLDAGARAYLGLLTATSGDWERGCEMVESAAQLNPNCPGYFYFAGACNAYRQGKYEEVLEAAARINMPNYYQVPAMRAAALGQLGRLEEAHKAVQDLLALRPDFATDVRREYSKWYNSELIEHMIGGLRKAGLEIPEAGAIAGQKSSIQTAVATLRAGAVHNSGATRADEGFWVAVLPFKYAGAGAELKALAEGLSEEIVTGLSRFSYLRVIARGSTAKYSSESGDVRTVGKELGARYVMEGSIRQAGNKLRLAVQLVDAVNGAHLWAENYERTFSPEAVFELQDDLVPRIVSTAADMNGVLTRDMSEAVRGRAPGELSPYEAVLRSFGYLQRVTPEELATSLAGLEQAVEKAPNYADAWAMLAYLCVQDYAQGVNLQGDALASGLTAARRAVEASPSNPLAYVSLAQVLFFHKEFQSFRNAAERAVVLNPMDGNSIAFLGELLTYAGERDRGLALAGSAKQLNPNHPGWYWYADFYNAYRQGDYSGARDFALKINLPGQWASHAMLAAACGQLGERESAAKATRDLLHLRPNLGQTVRQEFKKWWDPEYVESVMDGLRKAGLEMADDPGKPAPPASKGNTADSCAARADEGFWVAVLPFKYAGARAELKALADGLSEEVITGLSRFSYLRVIARGSTAKYSSESGDIRAVGKELGARYVMEGTLRQAGAKLRIAVQLVDASTGAHLWAETYERMFRKQDTFAVQDDIVDRVVATVADANGVLVLSIASSIEERPEAGLTALDWMLRSFGYRRNMTPEAHARLRDGLERFVEREPNHADVWACLAMVYLDEFAFGFNLRSDALGRAHAAARRSVKIDRSCQFGAHLLAQIHFFRRDVPAFRATAEDAMALNPRNTETLAHTAMLFVFIREFERGANLARRAMDLNPQHAGWYHVPLVWFYFQKGEYEQALDHETRINIPGLFWQPLAVAACCGLLGRKEEAAAAAEELRRLDKDIERRLWRHIETYNYASGFMDRILEGLTKAGLHITVPDEAPPISNKSESHKPGQEIPAAVSERTSSANPITAQTRSGQARIDESFWVAVLPFRGASGDADLEALADGLTEDVTTGLSRFPYLQVIAHNSAMTYKGRAADIRTVGRELGARYVIEGSIRKRGRAVRVSAQLMDAVTGTQLWAEAYDREISDAGTFQVQDDLTDHIVTTVADGYGVLVRSMAAPTRDRKVEELRASELVLRHYAFMQQVSPQEHAVLRAGLEQALEREPNHATAWACLSNLYHLEYFDRFNPREKPLERAREAAWRAVKIDPACQMGWRELAAAQFFSRDFTAFRGTAERAMSLNPRDGTTLAWMAIMIAFSGEWERGMALTQRAIELNRHHPGWYHNVAFHHHYRKGEYEAALQAAKRINMPEFHWMHLMTAASCGMLGRHEEARTAIAALRKYTPTFLDLENVREDIGMWDPDRDEVERLLQGLQKAGLKYGSADSGSTEIEPKLRRDPTAPAR